MNLAENIIQHLVWVVVGACRELGMKVVDDSCVIVELDKQDL